MPEVKWDKCKVSRPPQVQGSEWQWEDWPAGYGGNEEDYAYPPTPYIGRSSTMGSTMDIINFIDTTPPK